MHASIADTFINTAEIVHAGPAYTAGNDFAYNFAYTMMHIGTYRNIGMI